MTSPFSIADDPPRRVSLKKQRCVSIADDVDDVLKFVGDGSRSRGIRELALMYLRIANSQSHDDAR